MSSRDLLVAPGIVFGVLFWAAMGWYAYSEYRENNLPVDLAGRRSDACQSMARIGALDELAVDQCLTDNDVYHAGLRVAIETRADWFQDNLNKTVARVSETASRLDRAAFSLMTAERFFDIYDPFPVEGSENKALKQLLINVSRITISPPLEEAPEDLPNMWLRTDDLAEDDLAYSVDLDERVFEAMKYPFWLRCHAIKKIDGGCQGTVFVDLRYERFIGDMPVVIGFEMTSLTEEQATAIAFDLTASHFSDTSVEYDATRMKEVAELF